MVNFSFEIDQTDGAVQAGGLLSGLLHVRSSKSIPASELHIFFRGKEYTSKRSNRVKTMEKSQFVCLDMQLPPELQIIQNGKIEAGSYSVPFLFELPAWIPSSMCAVQSRETGAARIDYCLRAILLESGTFEDYQARHPICVVTSSQRNQKPVPHVSETKRQAITKFPSNKYCGEITCGVKVLDTQITPGQRPQVQVFFINKSTTVVEAIHMELIQTTTQSDAPSSTRKLCKTTVRLDVTKLHRLAPSAVKDRMVNDFFRGPGLPEQQIQHQQESASNTQAFQMLPVPETIMDSFDSDDLQVRHELKITLETESYHTNIGFEVPVTIARGPSYVPVFRTVLPVVTVRIPLCQQPTLPLEDGDSWKSSLMEDEELPQVEVPAIVPSADPSYFWSPETKPPPLVRAVALQPYLDLPYAIKSRGGSAA